jgi:hypothetical protein
MAIAIWKMREPASRILGMGGKEPPPKSAPPPRVTLAMTASYAQARLCVADLPYIRTPLSACFYHLLRAPIV